MADSTLDASLATPGVFGDAPDSQVADKVDKADHIAPAYGFGHPAPTQAPHGYQPTYQPAQMPQPAYAPAYNNMINNHVHVNVAPPTIMVAPASEGHSLIVRALWFVCIGWWLSAFAIAAGYFLVYTIIGLPLAFMLFNKLPQITTLRARNRQWTAEVRNGVTVLTTRHTDQYNWALRFLYFVAVGWWLGAVWLAAAYLLQFLLITIPITLWMYDRAPAVMTLHKH